MQLKKPFSSSEAKIKMQGNAFRKFFDTKKMDTAFTEQQYQSALRNLQFKYRIENRSPAGTPLKEDIARSEKAVQDEIVKKYGSEAQFKKSIQDIKWPDTYDDSAIDAFIKNPPTEVAYLPRVSEKFAHIELAAQAENSGFTNYQAYIMTTLAAKMTALAGDDPFIINTIIEPLLQSEIVPIVQQEVNAELRRLKQDWSQISKVPDLNTQNLAEI